MKISLGCFARSSIEAHLGADLAVGVELALRRYAGRLRSGPPPPRCPRFDCDRGVGSAGAELDLAVTPEVERILEREIEAMELEGSAPAGATSAQRLAVHAVFVYLAELDAQT